MELSLSQCDGKRSGACVGCICIKVIVPGEIGMCVCVSEKPKQIFLKVILLICLDEESCFQR